MAPKRSARDLEASWPGARLSIFVGSTPLDPPNAKRLCQIPLDFLRSANVPNVHSLVQLIGESTVEEPVQLRDKSGNALADIDVFNVGSLYLHSVSPGITLKAVAAPAGKSKYKPLNLTGSESTFSNSSNVSGRPDQVSATWHLTGNLNRT
jgi:hypothetical protein